MHIFSTSKRFCFCFMSCALRSPLKEKTSKISKSRDYGNASTFSFGYGSRAVNNATRPITLDNVLDDRDNDNLWQLRQARHASTALARQTSRLYHPGGSIRFNRASNSNVPMGTNDQLHSQRLRTLR